MFNEMRPFELLKLIRDGRITHVSDIEFITMYLYCGPVGRYLAPLRDLGLITVSENGHIQPVSSKFESLMSLGISLSQLTPYRNSSVVTNPLFGPPKEPQAPAELFVMMPFEDRLRPVYEDHIRAVAARLQVKATRADDFFAASAIVSDVWNAIADAQVLIADCTGRNANVFYELGIAHALGKPVILITQSNEDIPFDIQHIRVVNYDFTPRGMKEFETTLEATIRSEMEQERTISDIVAAMPSNE